MPSSLFCHKASSSEVLPSSLKTNLQSLQTHSNKYLPQPQDLPLSTVLQPGDWILLKDLPRHTTPFLLPYKGPFQVLLRTLTADKLSGHPSWIHLPQFKPADPQWGLNTGPLLLSAVT